MNNNRSPGSDGLSVEFYKAFWNKIKVEITEIMNNAYLHNSTSSSWDLGLVKLIYKKGNVKEIKNYRPITLLNVDYKILAKVLTKRMENILPDIIDNTQKCSIKNRSLHDAALNIQAAIKLANIKKTPVSVISFDQEKAFDRVDHDYLFALMRSWNLGRNFYNYVKTTYIRAKSKVIVNGKLTKQIEVTRGIRQGCPMSMMLYAMATEPLAQRVIRDQSIEGVKIGNKQIKIQQYADDLTATVGTEYSIGKIFNHLRDFEKATGQRINQEKTQILPTTEEARKQLQDSVHKKYVKDSIKILGYKWGINSTKETWNEKLKKIENILNHYRTRKLTWVGKVLILKSMATTLVLFQSRIHQPNENTIKKIESAYFKFLYAPERIETISRRKLIKPKYRGGLAIPFPKTIVQASKMIKWKNLAGIVSPVEFWQLEALFQLGSKIKQINEEMYTNSMQHAIYPDAHWMNIVEEAKKMGWNRDEWKEANFKQIYLKITEQFEHESDRKHKWNVLQGKYKFFESKLTNKEKVINYRLDNKGYLFGEDKKRRNLLKIIGKKQEISNCKFCKKEKDNIIHVFTECEFSKEILEKVKLKKGDLPKKDEILYNEDRKRNEDVLIISLYKKVVLKRKMKLDIDNKYQFDQKDWTENLATQIQRKIERRLEMYDPETSNATDER